MIIKELKIKGVFSIDLEKNEDDRGFFSRIYCESEFKKIGLQTNWVQMNVSFTKKKSTIRGLHYQTKPYSEEKIVRCIKGSICDVFVDLRPDSKTYGKWVSIELNEINKTAIYIPKEFAHGFQTLSDNVEVFYMHSNFYIPNSEAGINYKDPILRISWPNPLTNISTRDAELPFFKKK